MIFRRSITESAINKLRVQLVQTAIDGRIRGSQDGESYQYYHTVFDGYTELRDEDYKFQSMDGTTVIMKLPPDDAFLEEIVDILKTETYITRNAPATAEVIRKSLIRSSMN